MAKTHISEGFWFDKSSKEGQILPVPVEGKKPFKDKDVIVAKIQAVQKKARCDFYKGTSNCRICGQRNGSGQYSLETRNANLIWPEGFLHYVVQHNVKPSKEFLEQLNNLKRTPKKAEFAMEPIKKPHIDDMFAAFQQFQTESIRAVTSPLKHKQAQENLKEKLGKFGLLDLIDWEER